MRIIIDFDEAELKEICGKDAVEKYRRAMSRYQTSDNELIADRERKHREKICAQLSKHIKSSEVFSDKLVEGFTIDEDCYIDSFQTVVTEIVRFVTTLDIEEETK